MRVRVNDEVGWSRKEVRRLCRLLKRTAVELAGDPNLELSVVLTDEAKMRHLSRVYLKKDEVTDVLAFPLLNGAELTGEGRRGGAGPDLLGDILICLPVAVRQAESRGLRVRDEVQLLAVHGLLHLFGYEDDTEDGVAAMASMEKRLLGRNAVP